MTQRIMVKFLGGVASRNLTGSCTFFEIRRKKQVIRFLVDVGLWQGKYEDSFQKNHTFDIDVKNLDFVILTHSHIDHIGRLPMLTRMGFKGRVVCTTPTADLLSIMLNDTAKILKSEARYRSSRLKRVRKNYSSNCPRKGSRTSNHHPHILFSMEDVEESLKLVKNDGFEYNKWFRLEKGIELKFYSSGHVLGGAICVIKIHPEKSLKKPVFLCLSGDLGRKDGIILPPPAIIKESPDYWFIESIYGGMQHPPREEEIAIFLSLIRDSYKKKTKIILPSFALERTQEIIYLASYFMKKGEVPEIPIYLDSPLGRKITNVFKRHWNSPMFKDQNMLDFNPFDTSENPFLKVIESDEESVILTKSTGPYVVIAGSGMCEAGRIRNHLRAELENKNAVICLIGYMAPDTLGEKIRKGFPIVRINDEEKRVRARIVNFRSFSAHADGPFLVEYTSRIMQNNGPENKSIFIIHGNEKGGCLLKSDLIDSMGEGWKEHIFIPALNDIVKLTC